MLVHLMPPSRILSACSLMLCLLSPLSSQASECFSRSPSWQDDKFVYEAMKIRQLTAKEARSLRTMFKRIGARHKLKGKSETFDCYGNENNPRRVSKVHTIEANVETDSSNNLSMTLQFESKKDGISFQRRMRLFLSPTKLRLGSSSAVGDVELIIIGKNEVTFLVKSRLRIGANRASGPASGTLAREEINAITLNGRTLRVEMIGYTQGLLSHGYSWELR